MIRSGPQRNAFTLVELMVVIGILLILGSMLTSVIALAMRAGAKANTQAIMQNTATAIRAFQTETGVLPYGFHQAALFPQSNRLITTLGHNLDAVQAQHLKDDLDKIKASYTNAPHRFTGAHVPASIATTFATQVAGAINRLAIERARNAVLSGNVTVNGVYTSTAQIIPSPVSKGWQSDYLSDSIQKNNIESETGTDSLGNPITYYNVLDAYGNKLIYICPVIQGAKSFKLSQFMSNRDGVPKNIIDPKLFGLQTEGRNIVSTLNSSYITESSRRLQNDFELWSSGPDRKITLTRSDADNRDNIPHDRSYLSDLSP